MDDKSGMKKKRSAVSARPVGARAPSGRVPAVPAHAGPPAQAASQVQIQAAAPNLAEKMQVTETESGPNVKAYIERQLKSVYDDVLNQPIPDRFLELLNTLDESEANQSETEGKA